MLRLRPRRGIRLSVLPAGEAAPCALPARLILPIRHGGLDESSAVVTPGERVAPGQPLSRPVGLAARTVLSPLSATVRRVSHRTISLPTPRGRAGGPRPLLCVELDELAGAPAEQGQAWRRLGTEALRGLLAPWGLEGDDGLPLDLELALLPAEARLLVLAAAPAQALMDRLLEREAGALAAAVAALARLHAFRALDLVFPPEQRVAAGRLAALLEKTLPVRLTALRQGHPWDHPRLAAVAAGLPLPSPRRPLAAQGLLACGLDRLRRIERRLACGPATPLPVLVQRCHAPRGWPAPAEAPVALELWPGTPLRELPAAAGLGDAGKGRWLIEGSPLEGSPLMDPDQPVLPGHTLLTLWPAGGKGGKGGDREEACISCGLCLDICPVRLAPIRLVRLVEEERLGEAVQLGLEHCLDCGLCTWVCPSRVELGHGLRRGLHRWREARHGG